MGWGVWGWGAVAEVVVAVVVVMVCLQPEEQDIKVVVDAPEAQVDWTPFVWKCIERCDK